VAKHRRRGILSELPNRLCILAACDLTLLDISLKLSFGMRLKSFFLMSTLMLALPTHGAEVATSVSGVHRLRYEHLPTNRP